MIFAVKDDARAPLALRWVGDSREKGKGWDGHRKYLLRYER